MQRSAQTGKSGARGVSDQFMFGPALLINPVTTEGAKQRTVYLPAGSNWIDFWTGKRLNGEQSITAEAPLERIPIYARAGSIVPFGPRVESASGKPDPIDLRVYAGANGDFTLYEDEGDNYDYEHGARSLIPIHWDDKSATLNVGSREGSFPGMLDHRTFRVVIVREGHGTGITPGSEADATVADPSSYLVLRGPWKNGDRIELSLPMQLHAAPMPDRENLQAAMYGPLVLAARFDDEPQEKWYRHYQAQAKQEPAPALQFKGNLDDPASWLQPSGGKLAFHAVSKDQTVAFVPLSSIVHERYFVYHEIEA